MRKTECFCLSLFAFLSAKTLVKSRFFHGTCSFTSMTGCASSYLTYFNSLSVKAADLSLFSAWLGCSN